MDGSNGIVAQLCCEMWEAMSFCLGGPKGAFVSSG